MPHWSTEEVLEVSELEEKRSKVLNRNTQTNIINVFLVALHDDSCLRWHFRKIASKNCTHSLTTHFMRPKRFFFKVCHFCTSGNREFVQKIFCFLVGARLNMLRICLVFLLYWDYILTLTLFQNSFDAKKINYFKKEIILYYSYTKRVSDSILLISQVNKFFILIQLVNKKQFFAT